MSTGYILPLSKSYVRQAGSLSTIPPTTAAIRNRLRDNRLSPVFPGTADEQDQFTTEVFFTGVSGSWDVAALLGVTDTEGVPADLIQWGTGTQINFESTNNVPAFPLIQDYPESSKSEMVNDGKGNFFRILPEPQALGGATYMRLRVPDESRFQPSPTYRDFNAGEWIVGLRETIHPAKHLSYEAVTPIIYNGEFAEQVGAPFDRITVEFVPSKIPVQLPTETVLWWPTPNPEEVYLGRFIHPFSVTLDDNGIYRTSAVFEEARRPFYV